MKKLLSFALVAVLVASFVFGVMATSSQAKYGECYYKCGEGDDCKYYICCPPGQVAPDKGPSCTWTGSWCC